MQSEKSFAVSLKLQMTFNHVWADFKGYFLDPQTRNMPCMPAHGKQSIQPSLMCLNKQENVP